MLVKVMGLTIGADGYVVVTADDGAGSTVTYKTSIDEAPEVGSRFKVTFEPLGA